MSDNPRLARQNLSARLQRTEGLSPAEAEEAITVAEEAEFNAAPFPHIAPTLQGALDEAVKEVKGKRQQ